MVEDGLSLEVATEELRVADEELRAQQETIDKLVRGRLADELATSRLAAAMPVPLVDTDGAGAIVRANPAAGALLHLDVARLRGKPLLAFVAADDRRAVRTALTRAAGSGETTHLVAHLTPRKDGVVLVDIAMLPAPPPAPGAAVVRAEPDGDRRPGPEEPVAARWVLSVRGESGEPDTRALAALAAMSTLPVATSELRSVLHQVASLAVEGTAPAISASLTVGPPSEPEFVVSTDMLSQSVDGAQFHHGAGPGWDAYASGGPVTTGDLAGDPRWTGLGDLVKTEGSLTVLAVPMLDGTAPVGVLSLVGTAALTRATEVRKVQSFGITAAAIVREHRAIADLRRIESQLRAALTSRAEIDQAKGVLMAQRGLTADQAFTELTRASQHANVKLRDIARQVVDAVAVGDRSVTAPSVPARPRRGSGSPS